MLIFRRPSALTLDTLLGFTAGVMLAATAFSLLVPALDRGSLGEVLLGFVLGSGFIAALDLLVPHAHTRFRERGRPAAEELAARERATLLLSALTIHNVPEGLAVGVAFAAAARGEVPTGSSGAAAGVAALTGVVEPPAALAAYATFELSEAVLAGALAFAAGAMLYVVVDELVPESHGHGHERAASLALLGGFALMMGLDNAFG